MYAQGNMQTLPQPSTEHRVKCHMAPAPQNSRHLYTPPTGMAGRARFSVSGWSLLHAKQGGKQ